MKNADKPAAPFQEVTGMVSGIPTGYKNHNGLTKREMFAMHMMAAWIQHHGSSNDYGFADQEAATSAVNCADALLAELDRTK